MSRTTLDISTRVRNFSQKIARITVCACASLVALFALSVPGQAQGAGNTDAMTPPGLAPGRPEGSYSVSGIESVNLYNGNLNFNLPLLRLGGRGSVGASMNLNIDTARWEMLSVARGGSNQQLLTPRFADRTNYREFDYSIEENCTLEIVPCTERNPDCSGYATRCKIKKVPQGRGAIYEANLPTPNGATGYAFFPVWRPVGSWTTNPLLYRADGDQVGYGPGVLRGRLATAWESQSYTDPNDPRYNDPQYHYWQSLYRLTFTDSTGTEHDLIDTLTGGQPIFHSWAQNIDRGRVFTSNDGSAMTFIADAALRDSSGGQPSLTGYLFFSDGTRGRVLNGLIQWLRDTNGNVVSYTYGTDRSDRPSFNQVIGIRDSLGRQVTITYADMTTLMYDEIKFKGVGGNFDHSIKVWHARMGDVMQSGQTLKTVGQLFTQTTRSSTTQARQFNPAVISKVDLPDGRSYRLKYNSYGEIARLELPTGAVIEYDYADPVFASFAIHRRIKGRRVSSDGGLTWESKQLFNQSYTAGAADSINGWGSITTVESYDLKGGAERLLSLQKHYFYGDPIFGELADFYAPWKDGREYKVESLDPNSGAVLRTEETDWEQGAPAVWWVNFQNGVYQPAPENGPPNNPRIAESRITLENGLVSKKVFKYSTESNASQPDPYNILTDVDEYDFASPGSPARLLRRTHTDYVKTLNINGVTYDYGCDPRTTCGQSVNANDIIHIRNLPQSMTITDGVTSKIVSRTEFRYDEPGGISDDYGSLPIDFPGWVQPTNIARGNLTTTRAWLNTLGSIENQQAYLESHNQYDRFGNEVRAWDARGNVSEVKFASTYNYGFPTQTISADPDGDGPRRPLTSSSTYDFSTGVLLTTTDANQQTTAAEYNDNLDRLTKITRPDGGGTSYEYGDQVGNLYLHIKTLRESTSANSVLESYQFFDAMGRLIRATSRTGQNTWAATASNYDGVGRVIGVTNPYETTDYSGSPSQSALWTTTEYDALGRAWVVTTPDGAKSYSLYDGTRTLVSDQAGKQRISRTDALGRLLEVWEVRAADPATGTEAVSFPVPQGISVPAVTAGYRTSYSYDALGNLLKVEQGKRQGTPQETQRRYFAYDSLSRLIRAKHPEQEADDATRSSLALTSELLSPLSDNNNNWSLKYEYDETGNLKKRTDARGISARYTYDALNHVTFRDYSDATPDVTYTYDTAINGRGLVASIISSVSTTSFTAYDAMGRVTSSSQTTDGVTYSMPDYKYDLAGNLTSQTYPSGRTVSTAYDDAGRLSQVIGRKAGESDKSYASAFSYTAHGAVQTMKLGKELWEHTNFNSRLQPTEIGLGTTQNGVDRLKLNYSYGTTDNNGNLESQTITIPGGPTLRQTYTYDALNRLKSAGETNQTAACQNQNGTNDCWKQTYSYDRFGNRTFDTANTTSNAMGSLLAIDPANNRFTAGQGAIRYDQAGNLTRDFNGHTFSYDAENMQTQYDGGNTVSSGASYVYDGAARRVKKVTASGTTIFVYDAMGKLVAEYESNPTQGAGGTSYLTADNLGSPRIITGADGSVKARHDYLPFGGEIGLVGGRTEQAGYVMDQVRQKFTGQERDGETGLDYFQARYYSSGQGRFTSTDPLLSSGLAGDPQTWNRYAYVMNNPLQYTDSTGMRPDDQEDKKKKLGQDLGPNGDEYDDTIIIDTYDSNAPGDLIGAATLRELRETAAADAAEITRYNEAEEARDLKFADAINAQFNSNGVMRNQTIKDGARDLAIAEGLTMAASVKPEAMPAAALGGLINGMSNQINNGNKVVNESALAVDKAYREWRNSAPRPLSSDVIRREAIRARMERREERIRLGTRVMIRNVENYLRYRIPGWRR